MAKEHPADNPELTQSERLLVRAKELCVSDSAESVKLAQECLALAEAESRQDLTCQALNIVAQDLFGRDRDQAVELSRKALGYARACGRLDEAARSLSMIADAERIAGRLDEAQKLMLEAVQCAKQAEDRLAEAEAVNVLGALAWHRGEFDLAINWFREVLRLREELAKEYDIAVACANLGLMYYEKGDLAQALELSLRSLEIRERIEDHRGAGEVNLNLGLIYCDLGDWEKGLESYFRALAEQEVAKDTVNMALCYNNIGEAYLRRGKLDRAKSNLEKALELAGKSNARWAEAEVLGNLGEAFYAGGDRAQAEDRYEQDVRICREIEDSSELAETLRRWAELDLARGDHRSARKKLDEALELCTKSGELKEAGNIRRVTGELLLQTGEPDPARERLEQSRDTLKSLGRNYELGRTLLSLGRLEKRTRDDGKASLSQALAIFENLGIGHLAAEAERLLGGREAVAGRAGLLHDLAELVCAEPPLAELCTQALRLFTDQVPATGGTIVLRDGETFQEGEATAPEGDSGGATLPLESPTGRLGTLFLRGDIDAPELRTPAKLLALGIAQNRSRPAVAAATRETTGEFDDIVGTETTLREVFATIRQVAPTSASVLILGENGTGKELVARAVHDLSNRADGPFITVNSAAIPEALLEAELLGIEKGTATGVTARTGKFEEAHQGTLFLDEIGDMSLALQAKMLRALQEKTVERVGGRKPIAVDARVVAATNRDLEAAISRGDFRQDLFYRLNVVRVELPPVRERRPDIPALVAHYVGKFAKEYGKPVAGVSDDCLERLVHHAWPGNVRELRNAIERGVILTKGELVTVADLPPELQEIEVDSARLSEVRREAKAKAAAGAEQAAVVAALEQANWVVKKAADRLGISRVQLYRIMKRHGLKRPPRATD